MISRYYSHSENHLPEPATECLRKFGLPYNEDTGMVGKTPCGDCGETWNVHANFYCLENRKMQWTKPNPYNSVITSSGMRNLVCPPTGNTTIFNEIQTSIKETQMKPYVVLSHNLADPGAIGVVAGAFETVEAAQDYAESLIAQADASLTSRVFRTLIIINSKTGERIKSHIQAPPKVDWVD